MNYKVNLSEVTALQAKIRKARNSVDENMGAVNVSIEELNSLDSFKGKSARISKHYFSEFHQTIIDSINHLFNDLERDIGANKDDFLSAVDNSQQAKFSYNYLEERKERIESLYNEWETLSQSVHKTLEDVSDLIYVTKPNLVDITNKKKTLVKVIDDLVRNTESFHNKKKNKEIMNNLVQVESLLKQIGTYEGEERFTSIYKSQETKATFRSLSKFVKTKQNNSFLNSIGKSGELIDYIMKSIEASSPLTQGAAMTSVLMKLTKEERKLLWTKGIHDFELNSYVRNNNLLTVSRIHKIPNAKLMDILKQTMRNKMNPVHALKDIAPYKQLVNKSLVGEKLAHDLMKNQFNNIKGLKEFQELKKLPLAKQFQRAGNTFVTEIFGKNSVKNIAKTKNVVVNTAKSAIKDPNLFINNKLKSLNNFKLKDFSKVINKNSKKNLKNIQTNLKNSADSFKSSNILGKVGKLAGPIGVGIDITSNFIEHKDNPQKAIVGSAVDISAGVAAAATGAAVGSLILPPIGTAVGAGVGILVNVGLNLKFSEPPKSILDHTKDNVNKAVNKTKEGVGKAINKISGWFK